MANTVRIVLLNSGLQKALLHVWLESDGNEGELVNRVLLDPSLDFNLVPNRQYRNDILMPIQMSILQVWTSTSWFDIILGFNTLQPRNEVMIGRDADFYMDFRYFGGIKDQSGNYNTVPSSTDQFDLVAPNDGKLLISTKDFAPAGSIGHLVIELKKN